jgi:hypothetical protein
MKLFIVFILYAIIYVAEQMFFIFLTFVAWVMEPIGDPEEVTVLFYAASLINSFASLTFISCSILSTCLSPSP